MSNPTAEALAHTPTDLKLSDDAVEAGAVAIHAAYAASRSFVCPWDKQSDRARNQWRAEARAALTAALPLVAGVDENKLKQAIADPARLTARREGEVGQVNEGLVAWQARAVMALLSPSPEVATGLAAIDAWCANACLEYLAEEGEAAHPGQNIDGQGGGAHRDECRACGGSGVVETCGGHGTVLELPCSCGAVEPVELDRVAPADVLKAIRDAVDLAYRANGELARVSLPATFVDWLWQQHALAPAPALLDGSPRRETIQQDAGRGLKTTEEEREHWRLNYVDTFEVRASEDIATLQARIAELETERDEARRDLDGVWNAIGPTVRFMDPPDGGSPTIGEQVRNMHNMLEAAEKALENAGKQLLDMNARRLAAEASRADRDAEIARLREVAGRALEFISAEYDEDAASLCEQLRAALTSSPAQEPGGWRTIESAPYSEPVEVRVGEGMIFLAKLMPGASENEHGTCDQWQAVHEGEHPPCWSEGACWESNTDETESLQPREWRPAPPQSPVAADQEA